MSLFAVPTANLFRRTERIVLPALATQPIMRCRADLGLELATGIKTWRDITGSGNHQVQATGSKQATLSASAINGLPAVLYDGVDDFHQVAFTLNQPCTVFVVYKMVTVTASGSHDVVFDGQAASAFMVVDTTPRTALFAGSTLTYSAKPADGAFVYQTIQFNGNSSYIRHAGAQVVSGAAGANNPGGISIGALRDGTRSGGVLVAEIIAVAGASSAADVTLVETYFASRYAL